MRNENSKKVSIIIPVYNVEKYLAKCLETVILNKTEEVEILLINDGATDNSESICKNFLEKDRRIRYFSRENKGCSSTRNFGIKESRGEYIWFIDSDDYIEENAIEEILEELKKNEVELLIFGYSIIKNGKSLKGHTPNNINDKNDIYKKDEIFNKPWNKIYSSKILKENNLLFPENCHMGEDMAFNFKYLYFIQKIKEIQKPLYNYVVTNGAMSNINKRKEIFFAFDDVFDFYARKEEDLKNLKQVLKKYYKKHAILFPYEMILNSSLSKKEKEGKINELNKELNRRKNMFGTQFLYKQLYYYLKYKFYFLKPYYNKIKKGENL